LHMACLHVMQAQGVVSGSELGASGASEVIRSNVEVITPYNLPRNVAQ